MYIISSEPEKIDWDQEPDVDEFRRLFELSTGDPRTAAIGFEKLAAKNSIASMLHLASGYMQGVPEKSRDKAKYWYSLAANKGHVGASMVYGRLCLDDKEYISAKTAFERVAQLGDPEALYFLGEVHLKGNGDGLDKKSGLALLNKSSDMGFPFATRDLAILMLSGRLGFSNFLKGVPLLFRSAFQLKNLLKSKRKG